MGCGSSSNAEAPGKYNDDPDMMDSESRTMFDKKTGKYVSCAEGKDEDGPESDFFEVEEA